MINIIILLFTLSTYAFVLATLIFFTMKFFYLLVHINTMILSTPLTHYYSDSYQDFLFIFLFNYLSLHCRHNNSALMLTTQVFIIVQSTWTPIWLSNKVWNVHLPSGVLYFNIVPLKFGLLSLTSSTVILTMALSVCIEKLFHYFYFLIKS